MVLLLTFYGHITVVHIFYPMRPSRAKLTGYSWVAQDLELTYMLIVLLYFLNVAVLAVYALLLIFKTCFGW